MAARLPHPSPPLDRSEDASSRSLWTARAAHAFRCGVIDMPIALEVLLLFGSSAIGLAVALALVAEYIELRNPGPRE